MPWNQNGGGGQGPWGQGPTGGGQQPPNLDDLLKKGQEQIRQILPGGGRGFIAIIILVVLGWLATGFYTVDRNEQGLVLRFGEFVGTTSPGWHYHWPYPIETVYTPKVEVSNRVHIGAVFQDNKLVREIATENLMLTGDENIVKIMFTVLWKIKNAADFIFNIELQENTIREVAESSMRELAGREEFTKLVTTGRTQLSFEVQAMIQAALDDYKSGIIITQVAILPVDAPDAVVDSFRDVQVARTEIDTVSNQANTYSKKVVGRAEGDGQRIENSAKAYRERVRADAAGQANRFSAVLLEYKKAKKMTRKRMYLETMERVLGSMDKIILDTEKGQAILPYLSLNELRSSAKTQGATQ